MIRNQRDKDLPTNQEGSDHRAPPTSSRLWSGLKNPRIIRVSRAFGGKDRHSKVATVRGLRDRRVRLSVPTAIQLYDLQDRLGLNQPSKVVDWLLNAAQHEIDKLPPLQLSPEGFIQLSSKSHPLSHEATPSHANGGGLMETISQYTRREDPRASPRVDKGNTAKGNDDMASAQVLSHGILQRPNHSLASGFLSNTMPYASYYQWEAANAYLSQLGIQSSQSNEAPVMSIPSSRSQLIESQIVFCPPGIMPQMFTSNVATPMDFSAKQFGQLQMTSSLSQTPQSNLDINSLHLSSPPARPFQ